MRNMIVNTTPMAAVDCVSIFPTKYVSAMLYRLTISMLMIVGIDMVPITFGIGACVRNV